MNYITRFAIGRLLYASASVWNALARNWEVPMIHARAVEHDNFTGNVRMSTRYYFGYNCRDWYDIYRINVFLRLLRSLCNGLWIMSYFWCIRRVKRKTNRVTKVALTSCVRNKSRTKKMCYTTVINRGVGGRKYWEYIIRLWTRRKRFGPKTLKILRPFLFLRNVSRIFQSTERFLKWLFQLSRRKRLTKFTVLFDSFFCFF